MRIGKIINPPRKSFYLSLIVFLMALLPRVITLNGVFITTDETLFWDWANEFFIALVNRDWPGTLIGKGYPYITVALIHSAGLAVHYIWDILNGQTATAAWSRLAVDQPLFFDLLGERRLVMGFANSLVILWLYQSARKLMGAPAAFLGTGLLAFAPFLLADARTMRGDALLSSLMALSVLGFLLFLQNKNKTQLVVSGVSLGLAILTKITAVPVMAWAGLAVAIYLWGQKQSSWPARLKWGFLVLAGWGTVITLTVFIFWPALWVTPQAVFTLISKFAASAIDGRLNFFRGQLTTGEPLPLFYPTAFLFRATPLVLLGTVGVISLGVATVWQLWARRVTRSTWHNALDNLWTMPHAARWTILALGAYTIIFWIVLNAGALKRDRYLMPIFPAIMFIAAAGLLWLIRYAVKRWPGSRLPGPLQEGRWAWIIFSGLVGLELTLSLASHPFYYTYWNPLMGGGRAAANIMMAEGGVDTSAAVLLGQRSDAADQTISIINIRDFRPAFPGDTVRLVNNSPWITADHIILRLYHFQTEKHEPFLLNYITRQAPEQIVEYQGYTWAWIYPGPAAQYYANSQLDGKAKLLGYNLGADHAAPDSPLRVKLFWQNKGYQSPEHIFVRLVDAAGFVWAETTVSPLPEFSQGAFTPETYIEGEADIQIPPGTPPGLYFLKIGIANDAQDIGEFSLPSAADKITLHKTATETTPPLTQSVNQKLDDSLTLLGTNMASPFILTPQSPEPLTLYWRADNPGPEDSSVIISLHTETGAQAATWTGQPARGLYPAANWSPGELIRDPWLLDLQSQPEPVPPGRYELRVTTLVSRDQTSQQIPLGNIEVMDRRRLYTLPDAAQPIAVRLGDTIELAGYGLSQAPLTGAARFTLTLYWQAHQAVDTDYTVFTQILGPDGAVIGQHDGTPADGALPTTRWDTGEIIPDRHQIEFPLVQPGEYRLIAGMYNPATGQRLPVFDSSGVPGGDFWQIYSFTIEPPKP
jgi:hypothetical protein